MNIKTYLKRRKELIDEYLKIVLPFPEEPEKLHQAIWDCMLNGGKRIRAIIMLAIADLVDIALEEVINSAAGFEMIHTGTLILDDLPSMDDALLRRGKPALHRVYGEGTSILVANVLLFEGIRLVQENLMRKIQENDSLIRLSSEFLSALGKDGVMIGQFLDLTLSNKELKLKEVEEIHRKKTVSLFEISAKIAAVLSRMSPLEIKAVTEYGFNFGMAFQISDDIIALENKPALTGKLSLTKERRPNYVLVCGKKEAQKRLRNYVNKAIESLKIFKAKAEPLTELAQYLKGRVF